jgi:hypothetical protein
LYGGGWTLIADATNEMTTKSRPRITARELQCRRAAGGESDDGRPLDSEMVQQAGEGIGLRHG